MVVDTYRTNAWRCAGEEKVASLDGEIPANIFYYPVNAKQHILAATSLYSVAVDVKMEVKRLHIAHLILVYPVAYDGRTVEPLAYSPWVAFRTCLTLHVSCREINTNCDSIVIPMCKACGDRFAKTAYPYYQLSLIVYSAHEIWHEERLVSFYQGGVCLCEYHRFLRFI